MFMAKFYVSSASTGSYNFRAGIQFGAPGAIKMEYRPLSAGTNLHYAKSLSIYYTTNSADLVHERTIPTDRPPLVGELSGCREVSAKDPHGRILGFLDRSRYYFSQVAP
jgi:hypothetical protein